MSNFNNILFLGLGAIGTAVASKFQDAGIEFDVLCDEERAKKYSKENFIVNGEEYTFNYKTNDTYSKKADFVIIATKYTTLIPAISQLEGILAADCVIMSLLNGIDSEEIIGSYYGADKMVYAYISRTDATKIGNVNNFSKAGKITFGEKSGLISIRAKKIAELFDIAKVEYNLTEHAIDAQWWKYMANIGMNQVSAVSNACYGDLAKSQHLLNLVKMAMKEVQVIAKLKGINLREDSEEKVLNMFPILSPQGKTSMYQDVLAKRKTEVEMFAGQLIKMGKELGVETPVNQVLYEQIKAIESMY